MLTGLRGSDEMLCYRDRTYCEASDCAKWDDCDRALTDEVRAAAGRWWERWNPGKNSPLIYVFLEKPDCYEEE